MGSSTSQSKKMTRADDVYRELRGAIMEGRLLPGDPLNEATLGKEFSVSRTPIREAIRKLETDGLVETVPFRGARVGRVSRQDMLDAFDIREWVEPPVFDRAAAEITDEQLGDLRILVYSMPAQPRLRTEATEAIEADLKFHQYVFNVVGNQFATALLEDVLAVTKRAIHLSPPARFGQAREEHVAILNALAARDGSRAGTLIQEHIVNARLRFSGGYSD